LVWAGSPEHKRDRYRSIALASCTPLFDVQKVRFVSLQKGSPLDQLDDFEHRDRMLNLGPDLDDLADTAAVIEELDLVISVDTAVVHLAGAMGRRVWTLVPTPSDWRWLLDRDDSPWYPTMRLFRQTVGGQWASVVESVKKALAEVTRANNWRGAGESTFATSAQSTARRESKIPASRVFSAVSETRYGIIQYLPQPPAMARSLELYGEYLELQVEVLRRLLSANDTVVEFGAGCGSHTIALATIGHYVIAHEVHPTTRRILRQNVRANKLLNVAVLPSNSAHGKIASSTPPIPRLTLDALALNQLGLVKVNDDTLGDILRGAEGTLWRLRPTIFAVAGESNGNAVREGLATFGYRCWRLETPLFNPDNFNRRPENDFGDQTQAVTLAVPEERDFEVPAGCQEIR
jgi:protein-L-isoaspartate O-methyltransferase